MFILEWSLLLMLLICPLMMLFMHGSHKGHKHGGGIKHEHSDSIEKVDSCKVKQLEEEIEFLKEQNELLHKKVEVSQRAIDYTK